MNSPGDGRRRLLSPRLVMISGPIASGKSTLAAEIVRVLRTEGLSAALTDLDTVAGMALPGMPDWSWAHAVHAQLVAAWLATDVDVVIDEGTSSLTEVRQVLEHVSTGTDVFHVVLTADYDKSLARARADAGRGLSQDPDFLRADHDAYSLHLADLPCSLRLHVEGQEPADLAEHVLVHLALTAPTPPGT